MKILNVAQIKEWDAQTIDNEPIASIDLMERAASAFAELLYHEELFTRSGVLHVFCGSGNNGGDGLAIARLLSEHFTEVNVYHVLTSSNTSADFQNNAERLLALENVTTFTTLSENKALPVIEEDDIIVDAILGSGLKKAADGFLVELFEYLNESRARIWSVDIPSGMFADRETEGISINAYKTLTFQMPKLGFFFEENQDRIGEWEALEIQLDPFFLAEAESSFYLLEQTEVKPLLKKRKKFTSKSNYGHALLMVGSYGKMGAAVLAARACMRTGVGLLTLQIPKSGYEILQTTVPEAMVKVDSDIWQLTQMPSRSYDVIGIGPGIGTSKETVIAFEKTLKSQELPMIIDADALNILGYYPDFQAFIPKKSILTPHNQEFERLFGKTDNDFERNALQRKKAVELGIIIILKGAHTAIALPDGKCYFNSTGNPGMATGGSGDVLTGILTGLIAQGYTPESAALLGVWLHGEAGDCAMLQQGEESLIASDLIINIGRAYETLRDEDFELPF
jgi:ADP-dependent NAD(P)H-hydrate dehydratase / NAD(P)H-hydrate epimerase